MDRADWQARWGDGRTNFHQSQGNSRLQRYWTEFLDWCGPPHGEAGTKVLVPLCGKTPDLRFLAKRQHRVLGVEFVESAVQDYFREAGVEPRVESRADALSYSFEQTEIMVGDFLALEGERLGRANLAYDRAALVAIPPERRSQYVATLTDLLEPGGGLFLISFEHDLPSGPPFSVPEVPDLFGKHFAIEQREKRDILEEEPRFGERGATHMHEIVWYARRTA